MSTVYILGAGFSRAISSAMPLLSELSEAVVGRLRDDAFPGGPVGQVAFGHDFEAWMSFLHTAQPWLSPAQNLLNRAAFLQLTSEIASAVHDAQDRTTRDLPPPWQLSLTARWIAEAATIITFNYDDLVERAAREVLRATRTDGAVPKNFYPIPIPSALTRAPGGLMFGSGGGPVAFPVLKLHGSASWCYSGFDSPHGDIVYRTGVDDYWRGAARNPEDMNVADKIPFIVPPTASKNEFYKNDLLSAQWRLAAKALQEATEVHILGYSAPPSDLLVRAFIGTNLRGATVRWVNPDPLGLHRVLEFSTSVRDAITSNNIEEYVVERGPVFWRCTRVDASHRAERIDATGHTASMASPLASGICPFCSISLEIDVHHIGAQDLGCPCCKSLWENRRSPAFLPGRLSVSF